MNYAQGNCGAILDGVTVAQKGEKIFRHVLRVASGERTKSETHEVPKPSRQFAVADSN